MENDDPIPKEERCIICGSLFQPVHSKLYICKVCKELLVALVAVIVIVALTYFW